MKYDIAKEFGLYRKFKPPLNLFALRAAKVFLMCIPKGLHSSKTLEIRRLFVPCRDGKRIRLYLFRSKPSRSASPVLFYLHGGGFVFSGAPYHYRQAKEYALRTGRTVVFAEYRLAFDHDFLTPLSDCVDAYRFVVRHAAEWGLAKENIAIAGDSAGGYLALALMKECRGQNLPMPTGALLVYPVVDPSMSSRSMQEYTDTPMWNAAANRKMWAYYAKGNHVYRPLQEDLSFLPGTYIETAQYDCLRDEGEQLYQRILNCGGRAELHRTKGTMHGYDVKPKAAITRECIERRIAFLKESERKEAERTQCPGAAPKSL